MKYPHRLPPLYLITICVSFFILTSGTGILGGLSLVKLPNNLFWPIVCLILMLFFIVLCVFDLNHSTTLKETEMRVFKNSIVKRIAYSNITSIDLILPSKSKTSSNTSKFVVHYVGKRGVEKVRIQPLDPFAFLLDFSKILPSDVPIHITRKDGSKEKSDQPAFDLKLRSFVIVNNENMEQTTILFVETRNSIMITASSRLPSKKKATFAFEEYKKTVLRMDEQNIDSPSFHISGEHLDITVAKDNGNGFINLKVQLRQELDVYLAFFNPNKHSFYSQIRNDDALVDNRSYTHDYDVRGIVRYGTNELSIDKHCLGSIITTSVLSKDKHESVTSVTAIKNGVVLFLENSLDSGTNSYNHIIIEDELVELPLVTFVPFLNKKIKIQSKDRSIDLMFVPEVSQYCKHPKRVYYHGFFSQGTIEGTIDIGGKKKNISIENTQLKYEDFKTWSGK